MLICVQPPTTVLLFPDPVVSHPVSAGFNSFTDSPPTPASAPERIQVRHSSIVTMMRISLTLIILCQVLLHADDEYEYYKVAVANGTRMTEGKVSVNFNKLQGTSSIHF